MQHLKSALMVALIAFLVLAATTRVDALKKIAFPS